MKTWNELIEAVVAEKREAAKRLAVVKEAKDSIMADAALVEQVGADSGGAVRLYVSGWDATLYGAVELIVADLKTDAVLLATLERALAVGVARPSYDNVNDWQAERVFRFDLPNGGTLKVEANVKADGTACRKVQVGVTTSVVPIYELRCD